MWEKAASFILRNRIPILIVVAIFTIFMGYKAKDAQLDYEYPAMLPEDDSIFIQQQAFKQIFGEDGQAILVAVKDSNFLSETKLTEWIAFIANLKQREGITNVLSVSNAANLHKDTLSSKFEFAPIFSLENMQHLGTDSLSRLFLSLPIYKKILYNDTSQVYITAITLSEEYIKSKKREKLIQGIETELNAFSTKHGVKIAISGLPYTRTKNAIMIRGELLMFALMAALVTSVIIFLFFRSFRIVFFSLLIVGTGVVWALGSMTLFGYKITILTGMLPPLLIVIGIPNSVYLLNKYHSEYRRHGNQIKALMRVITRIGRATFLTNLTTAAGFATFIITSSQIMIEFGVVAFLNIMGVFFLSILFIPIFFSFLPPPEAKHTQHLENKWVGFIIGKLEAVTKLKRVVVYSSVVGLLFMSAWGISQMRTTGYIVDDLPETNQIYKDLKFFEKHTGGIMPVEIMIDTHKPKRALKYATLKRMNQLQERLSQYPELSPAMSVVDVTMFARQAFYNGYTEFYDMPSSQELSFMASYLPQATDAKIISAYLDSTQQRTRISLRAKDVGAERMHRLYKELQAEVDSIFPANRYTAYVTGSSFVFSQGTTYLIKNLFLSLALAIILIAVFMAFMFKSLRMVFISIVPNMLPLLITAAIMGFTGVSIKPSTVLVFSIAFGISVDNAIHFLAKYRQELVITNHDIQTSVINALRETGVSIIYNAIILFLGFSIFTFSEFGGTIALGFLVSVTLLIAVFANLVLLPSLLMSLDRWVTRKSFTEDYIDVEDDIDPEQLQPEKELKNA